MGLSVEVIIGLIIAIIGLVTAIIGLVAAIIGVPSAAYYTRKCLNWRKSHRRTARGDILSTTARRLHPPWPSSRRQHLRALNGAPDVEYAYGSIEEYSLRQTIMYTSTLYSPRTTLDLDRIYYSVPKEITAASFQLMSWSVTQGLISIPHLSMALPSKSTDALSGIFDLLPPVQHSSITSSLSRE
ncbi:hypothetical protein HD806DRAFT_549245 [Xylariaceae sp. AK1471]|nr:hypothetical protein HD806DRAFT_549245 [Xylariaceae sp. AK1471]